MNKRTLWIGAVVLVLAAGCNRSTQTSNPQDGDRQASTITLTGCLQPGEQGLASREPNAASRSSEGVDQFVLANAKTPGSEAGAANDSTNPLYILQGKNDELRQHIGQQVEVVGKPQDSSASAPDSSPGNTRHLEVESVRMIAANCAP
jgi:hypothetical protein